MKRLPLTFYIFLILTVIWFVFMTYLSHQDGAHTGKTSYELAEKICSMKCLSFLNIDAGVLDAYLRRAAHVVLFVVLTILLGLTLRSGRFPFWPLVFTAVWSYADEATKPMIQGRHFSWFDVGLNLLGVVIGCAMLVGIIIVLKRVVRIER